MSCCRCRFLVPAQRLLRSALADMHEWYLGSLPGFDPGGLAGRSTRSLVSLAVGDTAVCRGQGLVFICRVQDIPSLEVHGRK